MAFSEKLGLQIVIRENKTNFLLFNNHKKFFQITNNKRNYFF